MLTLGITRWYIASISGIIVVKLNESRIHQYYINLGRRRLCAQRR